MEIRTPTPADADALGKLRHLLWPDASPEELTAEAEALIGGRAASTLPVAAFLAEESGEIIGFIEVSLRSHADGCDPARPVGFLEGWYVQPEHRRRGVGAALVRRAEDWARGLGCREIASDTWIDEEGSQRAHAALGFEVVDRCVNFRKSL